MHAGRVAENMLCAGAVGQSPNAAVCNVSTHHHLARIFSHNNLNKPFSREIWAPEFSAIMNSPASYRSVLGAVLQISQPFSPKFVSLPHG